MQENKCNTLENFQTVNTISLLQDVNYQDAYLNIKFYQIILMKWSLSKLQNHEVILYRLFF